MSKQKRKTVYHHFGFKSQLLKLQEEFFEMMAYIKKYKWVCMNSTEEEQVKIYQLLLLEIADFQNLKQQIKEAMPYLTYIQKTAFIETVDRLHVHCMTAKDRSLMNKISRQESAQISIHIENKLDRTIERFGLC